MVAVNAAPLGVSHPGPRSPAGLPRRAGLSGFQPAIPLVRPRPLLAAPRVVLYPASLLSGVTLRGLTPGAPA
jgi:hypothetical protein